MVVFVPFLLALTVMTALAFGYIFSALTVAYRDFRYTVPFMLQAMLYVSPVVWSMDAVEAKYHWLFASEPDGGRSSTRCVRACSASRLVRYRCS